ncbi:MAG: cell division protein FtsZ [Rikenellaceae bacterium]
MNESIIDEIALASNELDSIITVVGVGGAGGNAVNYMWNIGIRNVRFMVCNTDQQALNASPIKDKIRLGHDGLGAGDDPSKGRDAAIESLDEIRDKLEAMNTKMVFITAGMGGGTGTGAAPVIAKLAKEMDILTVAIVTSPLLHEGEGRYVRAIAGIKELKDHVDSLLIINNENIMNLFPDDATLEEAFGKPNEILSCAAKGIAEIITVKSNFVNVDFADVSKVMKNSGRAHLSVEAATGAKRAEIVAKQSLTSLLLDHKSITGAKKVLFNMATSDTNKLKLREMNYILNYIQSHARYTDNAGVIHTAEVIWGSSCKPELGDNLELVLVATGFDNDNEEFPTYDQLLLAIEDPNSPFYRMNSSSQGRDGIHNPIDTISPLASGQAVVLAPRKPRYSNIGALLRVPAYIARRAKMIAESDGGDGKEEIEKSEGSLF